MPTVEKTGETALPLSLLTVLIIGVKACEGWGWWFLLTLGGGIAGVKTG